MCQTQPVGQIWLIQHVKLFEREKFERVIYAQKHSNQMNLWV